MTRHLFTLIVVAFVVWMIVAVRSASSDPPVVSDDPVPPVSGLLSSPFDTAVVSNLRTQVKREHRRYVVAHRRVRQLTRTLQHSTTTREAIDLACHVYGSCDTLWRRAKCESGGYRYARNPSGAAGLFQFLPSTWASTPFASMSIWSPYAQALAAGWMQTHGRGGEWVCQ